MPFPLALRHSRLLAQYAVTMGTTVDGGGLPCCLWSSRTPVLSFFLRFTLADVLLSEFSDASLEAASLFIWASDLFLLYIFLCVGHKFTPLFVRHGTMMLIFFVQFIMHGCWKSVPCCNTNLMIISLFVTYGPICLIKLPALHLSWW